jgi:signal transduction histidine kinase
MAKYLDRATVLLDLAQLDARDYPVNPSEVDLTALATKVIEALRAEARFHGVRLYLVRRRALPLCLDPWVLELILSNLLSDAIKQSPGQRLLVRIELSGHNTVAFTVESDARTGLLLAPTRFSKSRVQNSAGGLEPGLNTWIVAQLVEAMAGQISIEHIHQGTTRWFVTLPFRRPTTEKASPSRHDSGNPESSA